MIDRKEVESLRALAEDMPHASGIGVPPKTLRELLRIYLAWLAAPIVSVDTDGGNALEHLRAVGYYKGQRVRLLPAGPDGRQDG